MKILVVNSGSSSLKYQLIDMDNSEVLAKGVCERIGAPKSDIRGSYVKNGAEFKFEILIDMPNHVVATRTLLDILTNGMYSVIKSVDEIGAVGHRVVHSGGIFDAPVLVTDEVLTKMKETYELAPLHNPASTEGAIACRKAMPNTPMVLVFDTNFHNTMPPKAYMYAIPYEDYTKYKIRKYGFHGTSHKFVSNAAAKFLGKKLSDLKIITCHLGNGASVCAVDGGICVDTSMGFTPLEGLVMGTRCGDMDLAAMAFLCNKKGMTPDQGIDYANHQCGVYGISGGFSDFRDLTSGAEKGDERCKLAIEMFGYRVKKYIGAYAAAMGGVDCIVFTAGIGEHTPIVRQLAVDGLEFLGVELDKKVNENPADDIAVLNTKKSRVKILLIPTNEELLIAQETQRLIK